MLEKTARKPSADPAQEKLRQHKATWNKEMSSFINDVIHFKKLMNGWPSKYYKERSRITMPLPVDAASLVGQLASHFSELAQEGSAIAQEQAQYSKTRRVSRKQQGAETLNKLEEKYGPTGEPVASPLGGGAPSTPPPGPDLSKQLAAWEQKYQLVVEGSTPFSRLYTRITTPTIGWGQKAKIRRLRMNMLKSCVKVYRLLNKLQVEIVKSSKASIATSHKLMQQVWNDWALVAKTFAAYRNNLVKLSPSDLPAEGPATEEGAGVGEGGPAPEFEAPTTDIVNEATAIQQDLMNALSMRAFAANMPELSELKKALQKFVSLPATHKTEAAKDVTQAYRNVLNTLNDVYKTSASSLVQLSNILMQANKGIVTEEVPSPPSETPKQASTQLQATAQKFVKKWLGKKRHELIPGDTSSYRLEIFETAKDARANVNNVMDQLEKGMSLDELVPLMTQVNKQMTSLRAMIRSLHYSGKAEEAPPFNLF